MNPLIMVKVVLMSFCFMMIQPAFAQAHDDNKGELAELKRTIVQMVDDVDRLTVGIVMVDEQGPVWIEAIGKGNLDNGVDASIDTMFRIGSVSKMFASLAVLKLVERGQLSLDDKLLDLAPDIGYQNPWQQTHPIRVVHLLEHTSGWDEIHFAEYNHNDPTPLTLKQGLDFHPHSRISRWIPGTRHSYSNANYAVAGYIVQKVSGQDFEDFVRQQLFEPMGLTSATYRLSEQMQAKSVNLMSSYKHILPRPAGAINISVSDMAKFVEFFVNRGQLNGQQIISSASLRRMETVKSTDGAKAGLEAGYGLANHSDVYKQWAYRKHSGGVNRSVTDLAYLPEAKVGYAIMLNAGYGSIKRDIEKLIRDYQTRNLVEKEIRPTVTVSEKHREIEGYYYPINSRLELLYFVQRLFEAQKLWFDGDTLKWRKLSGDYTTRYYPVSENQYKSTETGLITLTRTTDPLVGEVVHHEDAVLKPISAAWLFFQYAVLFCGVCLLIISMLLVIFVTCKKAYYKLTKKPLASPNPRLSFWPINTAFAAWVCLYCFIFGWFGGGAFASANWLSVGIMLTTVIFAVFSVISVYACIRYSNAAIPRRSYWFWTFASFIYLLIVIYLLAFGVIGIRVWA